MIHIMCPVCGSEDFEDGCDLCRLQCWNKILDLIPPQSLADPLVVTEIARYSLIAAGGIYDGYEGTRPKTRARVMLNLLLEQGIDSFVELGPGFGELIALTGGMKQRAVVDLSMVFLDHIYERFPDVRCVRGVADRLPLASTPALVSDGVFQTLPYKEAFLCEAARVVERLLVFSVGFRHNYPRRPQGGFDVRDRGERDTLRRFLEELGFAVDMRWLDTVAGEFVDGQQQADFLYVVGRKWTNG